MSYPKRPDIGSFAQFRRDEDARILACKVVGYDGRRGLCVNYRVPETGEIVERAMISVFDLVTDEEVALNEEAK